MKIIDEVNQQDKQNNKETSPVSTPQSAPQSQGQPQKTAQPAPKINWQRAAPLTTSTLISTPINPPPQEGEGIIARSRGKTNAVRLFLFMYSLIARACKREQR